MIDFGEIARKFVADYTEASDEDVETALATELAEAYARGRVDGAEAERKAAVAVYESREAHAKQVDEDTRLFESLEWPSYDGERFCLVCRQYKPGTNKGRYEGHADCALAKRLGR